MVRDSILHSYGDGKKVGALPGQTYPYHRGGRVSITGQTIAQLCASRCQTDIFDISADGRSPDRRSTAGQRIFYSQETLLANKALYISRLPEHAKYMPVNGDQLVSPETALYWLTKNTSNRVLSDARVLKWADDMVQGEWHNTGDPIMIFIKDLSLISNQSLLDEEPYLVSGQARLWAMWLTNTCVEHTIRYTDNPKVLDVIDTGKTRTVTDLLSTQYAKPSLLSGGATLVRGYEDNEPPYLGATTWEAAPKYPAHEIKRWLADNPVFVARVHDNANGNLYPLRMCKKLLNSKSLPPAIDYLLYANSGQTYGPSGTVALQRFWNAFETGENLKQGDPVLALRTTLLNSLAQRQKINRLSLLALVIKSWNFRVQERSIQEGRLRWRVGGSYHHEPFPTIL